MNPSSMGRLPALEGGSLGWDCPREQPWVLGAGEQQVAAAWAWPGSAPSCSPRDTSVSNAPCDTQVGAPCLTPVTPAVPQLRVLGESVQQLRMWCRMGSLPTPPPGPMQMPPANPYSALPPAKRGCCLLAPIPLWGWLPLGAADLHHPGLRGGRCHRGSCGLLPPAPRQAAGEGALGRPGA